MFVESKFFRIDITKENRKFIYGLYIYNNSLLFD